MMYLKCDAVGCDHVETADGISADHIGKPCPKCGANLLTKEDYEGFITIKERIDFLKSIGVLAEQGCDEDGMLVNINLHSGKTNITVG